MNDSTKKVIYRFQPFTLPRILFSLPTAMIGYHMHSDWMWATFDFIFWPISWCKWLICQEINLTIIKETFSFLTQ
jgi:hypothetical protein